LTHSYYFFSYFHSHSFLSVLTNSSPQCLKPSKSSPTSPRTSSVRVPSSSADAPSPTSANSSRSARPSAWASLSWVPLVTSLN
ncbi:hypothetical protein ANOM_010542, partial [Aspergillus nomiae NRRL 13137]